jgi:hypothetical protein
MKRKQINTSLPRSLLARMSEAMFTLKIRYQQAFIERAIKELCEKAEKGKSK